MEQTRIRECRRERRYWKEKSKMSVVVWVLLRFRGSLSRRFHAYALNDSKVGYFTRVVLLRIRGFLHALHLYDMTIPKKTSSRAKSRDPLTCGTNSGAFPGVSSGIICPLNDKTTL